MTSIDCTACIHADVDGNCTLEVTTTSFEEGCCDFVEREDNNKLFTDEERIEIDAAICKIEEQIRRLMNDCM